MGARKTPGFETRMSLLLQRWWLRRGVEETTQRLAKHDRQGVRNLTEFKSFIQRTPPDGRASRAAESCITGRRVSLLSPAESHAKSAYY